MEVAWPHSPGTESCSRRDRGSSKLERRGQMWTLLPKGQVKQYSVQEGPQGMSVGAGKAWDGFLWISLVPLSFQGSGKVPLQPCR